MKDRSPKYGTLIISFSLTLGLLALGMIWGEALSPEYAVKRLVIPLLRLMGFIVLGLVLGQIIEATGWTRHLSVVARPFFKFSNLGNRCSAAFTAAFISGVTSNAMLLDFFKEKKISKAQLFLTNYVNQLPAFFLHLPTTFFIVIPLTGVAGVIYFTLTFLATLLRTVCFLVFGHFYLSNGSPVLLDEEGEERPEKKKKHETIFRRIKSRLPGRIINIAVYVIPIYTLVFLLNRNGFFLFLNTALSRYLAIEFLPVESLSVVLLSFAAEFTSGFAAAGALMAAGVLTTKQTVLALLLGNITAFPIRALRHQLPRYMGIFSPKMGLQLLLSGQCFRIISIIVVGMIYYVVA